MTFLLGGTRMTVIVGGMTIVDIFDFENAARIAGEEQIVRTLIVRTSQCHTLVG
jgi:hypothetical protein